MPARPAGADAARRQRQLTSPFTSGGPELPLPARQAVASGNYTRVPLLIGTNHNEGRTFAQGFAGLTQQQADDLITQEYGPRAPAILARTRGAPTQPVHRRLMIGDIWTDSGFLTGIGGCPEQNLAAQFAATTPTYFYQFDDLHAPGLNNNHPGYQWGAGHAMELAYLWPSFNNGFSLYDLLTPAQLKLSRQMVSVLGRVRRPRAPEAAGEPPWPRYTSRPADVAAARRPDPTISAGTFAAEHQCSFWNAGYWTTRPAPAYHPSRRRDVRQGCTCVPRRSSTPSFTLFRGRIPVLEPAYFQDLYAECLEPREQTLQGGLISKRPMQNGLYRLHRGAEPVEIKQSLGRENTGYADLVVGR